MSLTDKMKLDHLWKKIEFNVAQTYFAGKEPNNESITSYLPTYSDNIWSEAERIPSTIPSTSTSVVEVYRGSNAVKCRMDSTAPYGKTWVAVRNYNQTINDTNRIGDWIPPMYDPSYGVKIWAGDPTLDGVLINLQNEFREAVFDYASGVLHFYGNVPSAVASQGIWIEGARYVGGKGIEGIIDAIENQFPNFGKPVEDLELYFESGVLLGDQASEQSEQLFTLPTGAHFILRSLEVSAPCLIECHDTSRFNDSNPYAFVATMGHLIDDGSYVMGNQRFYGPKFITLFNREYPTADFSYWKIKNLTGDDAKIRIVVKVSRFVNGIQGGRKNSTGSTVPKFVNKFTELSDAPTTIASNALLAGKQDGTKLEFTAAPTQAGQYLRWNGTGFEWGTVGSTDNTLLNQTYTALQSHVGSGGSAHQLATTLTAGFMSPTDKNILDNLNAAWFPKYSQGSGALNFNNISNGSRLMEIKNNSNGAGGTTMVLSNAPSGFSNGGVIQIEGAHGLWNNQLAIDQNGQLSIRSSSDVSGIKVWGTWKGVLDQNNVEAGTGITVAKTTNGIRISSGSGTTFTGGNLTSDIVYTITNGTKAPGIRWSGVSDVHSIYVEETANQEMTRLVFESGDNPNTSAGIGPDGFRFRINAYNNVATDVFELDSIGARFAVPVSGTIVTITGNGDQAPDFSKANYFTRTLTQNQMLLNPTGLVPGMKGSIIIRQDGIGNHSMSFDSYYKWSGGAVPTVTQTPNAVDRLDFFVVSATEVHCKLDKDIR